MVTQLQIRRAGEEVLEGTDQPRETVLPATFYPPSQAKVSGAVPEQLIHRYVTAARRRAITEQLEDGTWYAEVKKLPGVWAEGDTEEATLEELWGVIDSWVRFKIENEHRDLPVLDLIDLNRI